jgi:UDP-N-acetylmuramoylalanine--D-glutamate ligase
LANNLKGKKVTVLGLARSGKAVAIMLESIGCNVFCSDFGVPEGLEEFKVPYEIGGHSEKVFDADIIVVSPGIPMDSQVITKAKSLGIPLRGELDLSASLLDCKYAAVTGTSGKSTTTSLIAHILQKKGITSKAIGNIGDAVAGHVLEEKPDWIFSIEVSSFQCELMDEFHPSSAVFTNLSQDHLNRHGSMEEYGSLKQRMMRLMGSDDLVVLNADDTWSNGLSSKTNAKTLSFSAKQPNCDGYFDGQTIHLFGESVAKLNQFKLLGAYNAQNLMAASLAVSKFGVNPKQALISCFDFESLPHRMQFVGLWNGIRFINDSKATKPDSTNLTLSSLDGHFLLILGGSEKGSDFSALLPYLSNVRLAIIHGVTSDKIAKSLKDAGFDRFVQVATQHDAILKAFEVAISGDTVLLSPSCASFDQFKDYEHRGRVFVEEVTALAKERLQA